MKKKADFSQIEARLAILGDSPRDEGTVTLISRRPQTGEREILQEAQFTVEDGLVGDNWRERGSKRTADGSAHPDMQVAIMNSRMIEAVSAGKDNWHLAGDQLFLDFDLSAENLPIGQQFSVGEVVFEVTPVPHNGCQKFRDRFGDDAFYYIAAKDGHRRRGINVKVVKSGMVRQGDIVRKS
jgi:hypothetical protein